MIHATDTPEFAAKGLAAARAYAKIAPDSSHALHMPSHIFVRLGLWQESIDSNLAAAASAAQATREHRGEAHYQFHALDFLNYTYLQSGQESKARQVVKDLENVPGADHHSIAEHQASLAARNAFELHHWKDAAGLPIPHGRHDFQESTYRVRAIAAARLGDVDGARKNLQEFAENSRARSNHHGSKTAVKSVLQLEAEAWLAHAEGKSEEAVSTLRSAAEKEESDGVDSLAMPAREMLADLFLELKRPAEALVEYRAALKSSPARFDSLYGAARAARAAGDEATARSYYNNLVAMCGPGADRSEIAEARSYETAKRQ
jgi:tetratricopeptide (TPR) repeat protein